MLAPQDFWDPNTWTDPEPCRIYGDAQCQTFGLVSPEDYPWASRHQWCWKKNQCGKLYLRRALAEYSNGVRIRTWTEYLHVAVAKRAALRRATVHHKIVDHRNGDSTDNTRENLRWVTPTMNCFNLWGRHQRDLIEG